MDGTQVPGTTCDYYFIRKEGKFYSPLYPSSYSKGTRCSYIFHAKSKERIVVIFEELNLQSGDQSCLEREDVVKVHDGGSSVAPVIAVLCNELTTTELISTNNQLYIEFIAGSEWPGHGFRANYHFISISDKPTTISTHGPAVSATTIATTAETFTTTSGTLICKGYGCDVTLTSDGQKEGFIFSPNYPLSYPTGSNCKYQLIGSGKERIQIIFKYFNLSISDHYSNDCNGKDALSIYMPIDGDSERTSMLCGNELPNPIMSNGPRITLEFKSQDLKSSRGFKAQFLFTKSFGIMTGKQLSQYPCAFRYNSDEAKEGYFYSPNFPGNYPGGAECHYLFNGNPQERVKINFLHFDIEGLLPCKTTTASDYIEFSNYMSHEDKNSRHCGQLEPFEIESENKFFRITFKSNERLDGRGFNASYKFVDKPRLQQKMVNVNTSWQHSRENILPLIIGLIFAFR